MGDRFIELKKCWFEATKTSLQLMFSASCKAWMIVYHSFSDRNILENPDSIDGLNKALDERLQQI
ncbi:MAG: hypothetical protein WBA57_09315 [Elainellaceae cyanobacterium]